MIELFNRFLQNKCTPAEVAQLLQYFNLTENESLLRERINEILQQDTAEISSNQQQLLKRSFNTIQEHIGQKKGKLISLSVKGWMKIAAGIILLAGLFSIYHYMENQKASDKAITISEVKQDKLPGSNKAILLLSNGSKVMLDSSFSRKLGQQGTAKMTNTNGQLSYSALTEKPEGIQLNTVTTPRGGQYQLLLADGTKVWLNAASSIRYPVVFFGKERKVELSGEAYFEVAKNKSMPFKVNVNGREEVEVLGTHFNINSYPNEPTSKTTLLEGSVKVSTTKKVMFLKPGEQAQVNDQAGIEIKPDVNLEEVIAWKNGKFMFKSADLKTILNQVSRWYDVNIIYDGEVKEQFSGEIPRNVNLSELLIILEATKKIKLTINGNNVTVNALNR